MAKQLTVSEPKKTDFFYKFVMILIPTAIVIFVILCVAAITKPLWFYTNSTAATYKGYMQRRDKTYPIVEIDGVEYKSSCSQSVRDGSYIGNSVEIKYNNTFNDFIVVWFDEKS